MKLILLVKQYYSNCAALVFVCLASLSRVSAGWAMGNICQSVSQ